MLNLVELWEKGEIFEVIHQGTALWLTEKVSLGRGENQDFHRVERFIL